MRSGRQGSLRFSNWLLASAVMLVLLGCSKSSEPEVDPQYKPFADAHWSDVPYWDSLKSHRNIEKWEDGNVFPHRLPFEVVAGDTVVLKNDAFYENIGRYDQFIWGWDDLQQVAPVQPGDPEASFTSTNRLIYVHMWP